MTKLQDAEKKPFLDIPVSPTGLFGDAIEGFTERCIMVQKQSLAMQHFHFSFSNKKQRCCPANMILLILESESGQSPLQHCFGCIKDT